LREEENEKKGRIRKARNLGTNWPRGKKLKGAREIPKKNQVLKNPAGPHWRLDG